MRVLRGAALSGGGRLYVKGFSRKCGYIFYLLMVILYIRPTSQLRMVNRILYSGAALMPVTNDECPVRVN